MTIFNSYVKLPEGIYFIIKYIGSRLKLWKNTVHHEIFDQKPFRKIYQTQITMLRVQTRHCCSSEGSHSTPLDCYPLSTGWCATLSWDYVWNFGVEILHPVFFGGGKHRFGLVNSNDIRSKKTTIKLAGIITSSKVEHEKKYTTN